MRIIFIRHGHPDYARDCLTPLGHRQAQLAAQRLQHEGIGRIFASSHGRAVETAQHTADLLGLPVEQRHFMREIRWGAKDGGELPFGGHPWDTCDDMILAGRSLLDADWAHKPPFDGNRLTDCVQQVAEGLDDFLRGFGYHREGCCYRVQGGTADTVAIFSHGGSSSAMLAHLLSLPFPFVCTAMGPNYTAVTSVLLHAPEGELALPRLTLLGDDRHIASSAAENVYGL